MPVKSPGDINEIMSKYKGTHTSPVVALQTLQTFSVSKGEEILIKNKKKNSDNFNFSFK